ncbi:MAG: FAD-dependent oxidoreductase [Ignavibacteria bacterium]|nr:FAD-dependent oxidoreductase [Ignavibacteria bacterium]NCS81778.1 FAD-dependent oxidoreductase [Ignavibacteria bacterium]OIO13504.1 MAG: FAD-binding protein [Ignavibacteria bacterium CG1_02_37_35]
MKTQIEIALLPENALSDSAIRSEISDQLQISAEEINAVRLVRRSIDARKFPVYKLLLDVYVNETPTEENPFINYKPVTGKKKVAVVGFGPAGMFAALRLLELGIKPVIVERGKDVRGRRRDIKQLMVDRLVNPNSNYCFGEGGAGTFSDGKLYTRATKRGDVKKILRIFVQHGAAEDILVDTHPHLGSNKLPEIVSSIRETILRCGGEIHFESRVTDFILKDKKILGVVLNGNEELLADSVLLATGHSARDIFSLLQAKNILLEQKSFAMGVRIEHPQALINEMQYHTKQKNEYLPSANYSLACQVNNRGVFSFCMCPGGIIVPASTAPDELVVNGMSISKRNSPFANSGFVVSVEPEDFKPYEKFGPFAGMMYQKEIEHVAFEAGGSNQTAPAQRVTDFLKDKISSSLPKSSYFPGTVSSPLHTILPQAIVQRLKEGFVQFNNKMRGFITEEAQMLAAETRTSSPVRIPRDKETYMHKEITGLFPAGEGAGYAGGIMSSAMDGENCADAVARFLK